MKRSPYFFLRRQAEKRMQTYSLTSLVLVLATVATSGYAWQQPEDTTPRVAILANSKPPKEDIVAAVQNAERPAAVSLSLAAVDAEAVEAAVIEVEALPAELAEELLAQTTSLLPEAYDNFEPTSELDSNTAIGELLFSTEVEDGFVAINPRRLFAEGFYTLYATFDYIEMKDGMEWAWVWRYNGSVVDGGNELWNYGDDGLGFIYLSPEEGFRNGEYALEVWVNGEVLSQASVYMNDAAVAAGN